MTMIHRDDGDPSLVVEGRLAGGAVDELASVAADASALESGDALTIDLAGLTFVDAEGIRLLHRLAGRGARLVGGSPFITTLLSGGLP